MTANDLREARALYDAATPVLTAAQVDDLRPGLDLPPHEREWYRRGDLIALCNSHEALRAALDIERGISKSALDECASLRTRLVDVERESDEARVERDAERQESRRTRLDVEACCIKRDELEQERDAVIRGLSEPGTGMGVHRPIMMRSTADRCESAIRSLLDAPKEPSEPSEPPACERCGKPVEEARCCYVHPTCYACLPPPDPLPVRSWSSEVEVERVAHAIRDEVHSERAIALDDETIDGWCNIARAAISALRSPPTDGAEGDRQVQKS